MQNSHQTLPAKEAVPIKVQALHKSFGKQTVLDGITLEVMHGETLAVLGQSGTGKSVLLKLMIGLHKPDSGSICIHGQDVATLPQEQLYELRKKVGFLFQEAALYDALTVEENIAFPLRRHRKGSEAKMKEKIKELLASVGMEKDAHKMPGELSGGMQKRAGLARALALEPDTILFDEPTAGLDPITAAEIDELILELQKSRHMTSVIVTHDIKAVKTVSDHIILLRNGQILKEGVFEDLEKSQDKFVKGFMDSVK